MSSQQTSKIIVPLALVGLGIAILAGAGVWLAVGQSPVPDAADIDNVARVSAEESHAAVLSGEAVIVDVRDAKYFEAQHIAGAINIPEDDLKARLDELDPNLHIITYCT